MARSSNSIEMQRLVHAAAAEDDDGQQQPNNQHGRNQSGAPDQENNNAGHGMNQSGPSDQENNNAGHGMNQSGPAAKGDNNTNELSSKMIIKSGLRKSEPIEYAIATGTATNIQQSLRNIVGTQWGKELDKAKLAISISGGLSKDEDGVENDLELPQSQSDLKLGLQKRLVELLQSVDTILLTDGLWAGVTQVVSDAVETYNNLMGLPTEHAAQCVGVVPLDYLGQAQCSLDNIPKFSSPESPIELEVDFDCDERSVDWNHSHILFCESKSTGEPLKDAYLGAQKIRNATLKILQDLKKVIHLVVQGDVPSLLCIKELIDAEIPVLIVRGTGGVADVIADYWNQNEKSNLMNTCRHKAGAGTSFSKPKILERSFCKHFRDHPGPKETVVQEVEALYQNPKSKKYLHFFSMVGSDTTTDLSDAILHAILQSCPGCRESIESIDERLQLAYSWNNCDVARDIITYKKNRRIIGENKPRDGFYKEWFLASLRDNKPQFVRLFMETSGSELSTFLTVKHLATLYNCEVSDPETSRASVISTVRHTGRASEDNKSEPDDNVKLWEYISKPSIIKTIFPCMNTHDDIKTPVAILRKVREFLNDVTRDLFAHLYETEESLKSLEESSSKCSVPKPKCNRSTDDQVKETIEKSLKKNPEKHLFLWAVLTNKPEMAVIFWELTKNKIAAALLASYILKKLSQWASFYQDLHLREKLLQHSEQFRLRGRHLLEEGYNMNKRDTETVLRSSKLTYWGMPTFTVIDLAVRFDNMGFLSHESCQKTLSKKWMGKNMDPDTGWLMVLLAVMTLGCSHYFCYYYKKKRNVSLRENEQASCADNIVWDFFKSPVVIFSYHTLFHVAFLATFSVFLMFYYTPKNEKVSLMEKCIWIYICAIAIEEVKQFSTMKIPGTYAHCKCVSWWRRIREFLDDKWNVLDVACCLTIIPLLIGRLTVSGDFILSAHWEDGRSFYSLTLLMFYMRFLQVFFVSSALGPTVIMIWEMIKDLMQFLIILLLFLIAYSVVAYIQRFPSNSRFSGTNRSVDVHKVIDALVAPYWQMYGELFLEEFHGHGQPDGCTDNVTIHMENPEEFPLCSKQTILLYVLMILFMIFTNILLLNLVIAMFSSTYEKVRANSYEVWCLQRADLISECKRRSILPPPLNILSIFIQLVCLVVQRCKKNTKKTETESSDNWEKMAVNKVLRKEGSEVLRSFGRGPIQHVIRELEDMRDDIVVLNFELQNEQPGTSSHAVKHCSSCTCISATNTGEQ